MARLRDDLCMSIIVTTYFRCPISLDVMKSPVSLCTGFTYDRSSIQRWLDAGNNTCPVTMHLLQTKDLLPNRTLHRLIQIWSQSLHRPQPLLSPDQLLATLSHLQTQTESLRLAEAGGDGVDDAACVTAVMSKVLGVSSAATEHAVTTLWSVCYLFRDGKAQEAVTQANGLTKILLLMHTNCAPHVRQMCTDLLKIFRVDFRGGKTVRVCKTSQRGLSCPSLSMICKKWIRLGRSTVDKRTENVIPPRLRVGWQASNQPTYH